MEETEGAKRRDKAKHKQKRNEIDAEKNICDFKEKRERVEGKPELGAINGKEEDERRKKKRKLQTSDVEMGQENKNVANKVSQSLATGGRMEKEMNRTGLKLCSQEEGASNVAADSMSSLELLKLIRDREVPNDRKIQTAFVFVQTQTQKQLSPLSGQQELFAETHVLPSRHFVESLSEWVQTLISCACKPHAVNPVIQKDTKTGLVGDSMVPAHLDERYWLVFRWCLSSGMQWKAGFISLSVMQAFSGILDEASIVLSRDDLSTSQTDLGYGTRNFSTAFFWVLLDVVKLLIAGHERSFRPKLDLWVSSASSCLKLALTMCMRRNKLDIFGDGSSALFQLILFMSRGFTKFLKASPNPRKVFISVVEKLLESLLGLLGHLSVLENEGIDGYYGTELKGLLISIKDILRYTLFHPLHLEGYLNVCKLSKQAGQSCSGSSPTAIGDIFNSRKATNASTSLLSYHKLLFEQLDFFVYEGKVSTMGSFEWIFRTYIKATKGQASSRSAILYGVKCKLTSRNSDKKLNGRDNQSLGMGLDSSSDKSQEKKNSEGGYFAVFVEFLCPLMRKLEKINPFLSVKHESFMMAKLVLAAVNSLLVVAKDEQVYSATQDTSNLAHFSYLKNMANVLIHCSVILLELFNGAASTCHWNEESYCLLMAVVKEVLLGIGHILELEYRVFENDLQSIWKTLLSATTIQFTATKKCGKKFDVQHDVELSVNLASRVIQIFSELRQVDRPIFSLCNFLRHLANSDQLPPLHKLQCKALTSIYLSPRFLRELAVILKEVPEGQTTSFLRLLKGDLEETLKSLHVARVPSLSECHQRWQTALKALMEISICAIKNANVTASNSIQVEALLKALIDGNLMKTLGYLVDSALSGGNVLANFANLCAPSLEYLEPDIDGGCLANEAQACQAGVDTSLWTGATAVLGWEFMLRLYVSIKFLHRKCISLMPHKQAKKKCLACNDFAMSIAMGKIFQAEHFSGRESFFALVRRGAVSTSDFLRGIDLWLCETGQKKVEFLLYTLDCVAMLSISDLKVQIKAISFLLSQREPKTSENTEVVEQQVDGHVRRDMLSKMDRKILRKLCKKLKLEASFLTNFITKWISSVKSQSKGLDEVSHWNKVINSVDKRTLPVARWALLCQNIDVWSEFASENDLITFCRFMVGKTLLCDADKKNDASFGCHIFSVTSCLLNNDSFYEQKPIGGLFLHTLSLELLETLSTFKVDSTIISSLSYVESQCGIAAQEPASENWMRNARRQDIVVEKADADSSLGDPESSKLTKCAFLLNLVIQAPKGFINSSSAASLISCVSKLESSLLVWLLKTRCQWRSDMTKLPSIMECKRLLLGLDLLVASRRSMESLILHEGSSSMSLKGSCLAADLLHNTCSMYWPILSVHAVEKCFNDCAMKISDTALLFLTKEKLLSYIKCTTGLFTFVSQNLFRKDLGPLLMRYKEEQALATKVVATPDSMLVLVNTLATQLGDCFDLIKLEKSKVLNVLSKLSIDGSIREEGSTLQECPFGILAFLGSISTVLWSLTSTLECLDEKCHLDKDGNSKWTGQLPAGLVMWMRAIESFVTDGLHDLLLANENMRKNSASVNTFESDVDCGEEADKAYTFQDGDDGLGHYSDADMSEDSDVGEIMDFRRDVMKAHKGNVILESSAPVLTDEQRLMSAQASGDFLEMQEPQLLMIREMLCGKLDTHSWMLGELFMAMAAILKFKSLFHSPNVVDPVAELFDLQWTAAMQLHVGAASRILQEVVEMPKLKGSSCLILLPGVIKYLESIGSALPYTRPMLSPTAFIDLVQLQLDLHGSLLSRIQTVECLKSSDELKFSLQSCFRVFMKKPLGVHFHLALQTIERSLLGLHGRRGKKNNDIEACFGSSQLDVILLGGIECLFLVLDAVSGARRLQILSRYTSRYLAVIFHLIARSQHWCYRGSHPGVAPSATWKCYSTVRSWSLNNLGITLRKSIDVLITFSSREVIFPMKANHVAQAMSCPADLFKHFYQRNIQKEKLMQSLFTASDLSGSKEHEILIPDDRLVLEIYTACCKLLRSLLRHRTRESGHCVALLGESLRALLFFLEVMELSFERNQSFSELGIQSTVQCASWLRRVYEEVAEHKNIIGSYVTHMLSDYVCIISGYGMSIKGLSREVEATLRPGAFALVDICSTDDLQQLHAVLGEGPRRSTLTAIRREYEQHFKYTGKV